MFVRGRQYDFTKTETGFRVMVGETAIDYSREEFNHTFSAGEIAPVFQWKKIYAGRCAAFPELARAVRSKACKLGLDKYLSWTDYQFEDMIETVISPYGVGITWEMGLGKSRLAISLCMMGGHRNLVVVEPHLVEEMETELKASPLKANEWQVIKSPRQLAELRRVNVITYNLLRGQISKGSKRKYSHALRNRINTIVCDEGHKLRNSNSEQTSAIWQVNARRRFILTGTPIANYPRDVFYLLQWLGGDGTAAQEYGLRNPKMEPYNIRSLSVARRGLDVFRDNFVTLEWAVNEFSDTLEEGAKREVPRVQNLGKFREMLAPFFKRRVHGEPDVAKYVNVPKAEIVTKRVEWDAKHFDFYLKVAHEFASWYRKTHNTGSGEDWKRLNLVSLLARVGAVERATNDPATGVKDFGSVPGITSKQRAGVDRAIEWVNEGHKVIVYAHSPQLLERLANYTAEKGHKSVLIHGGLDIKVRTKKLNDEFRFGKTDILFASIGCTQTGLNLWQADRVIFLSRDWRAITERQALARVLRPQQKNHVVCEIYELPGSLDVYQGMMTEMKGDAADAGLDWATPESDGKAFLHFDHVLGQFCKDLQEAAA